LSLNFKQKFSNQLLARLFILTLVAGLLIYYAQKIDLETLKARWESLQFFPLLLASLLLIPLWFSRSSALWILLWHLPAIGFWRVFRANMIGTAIDQVLPARSGYVFRWLSFSVRAPHAKAYIASSLVASVVVEGSVLVALFLLNGVVNHSPEYLDPRLSILFWGGLILGAFLILLSKPVDRWAERLFKGKLAIIQKLLTILPRLRRPEVIGVSVAAGTMSWISQIGIVILLASSLGKDLSIVQSIAALLVINLAIVVPVTPGNLGTMQAAFIFILTKMGFSVESALVFSILFQLIHGIPSIAVGAVLGFWTSLKERQSVFSIFERLKQHPLSGSELEDNLLAPENSRAGKTGSR